MASVAIPDTEEQGESEYVAVVRRLMAKLGDCRAAWPAVIEADADAKRDYERMMQLAPQALDQPKREE